jgi:uncharacterized protein (TIGR02300 family)
MAKPDLGTKRVCPETGRKFYDLNKDPIVSPYTGQSYQRSYFESTSPSVVADDEVDEKEVDVEEVGAELISLEEADDEAKGDDDLALEDDVDLGDDDEDDTFLAEEEEDEDDVSGIVNVDGDDDEG